MSEPVVTDPPAAAPEAPPTPTEPSTPPWGDDFDPARAWDKIQKTNSEAKNLRERLSEIAPRVMTDEQANQLAEYGRLVEASKSDMERKDEALATAASTAQQAQAEALRYKIALKHGLSEADFELLGSGTEEQVEARAQLVAEKNAAVAAAQAALEAPTPTTPTPRRPGEALRPGATPPVPQEPAETDYPSNWLSPTQRARIEQAQPK